MSSLASLNAVYATPDQQFTLQNYTFQVGRNRIVALHRGVLEYTAGDCMLTKRNLSKVMYDLIKAKDMPVGNITITYTKLTVPRSPSDGFAATFLPEEGILTT